MSEWPEIPVVKVLGTILAQKDNGEKEEAKAEAQGAAKGVLMPILTEKVLEVLSTMPEIDSPCTCKAAVICSEATAESVPVHIKVDGGTIHLSGLYELNKTNIQLEESFAGCKKDESRICKIAENYKEWILDNEWKEVDGASSQGEGKETLSRAGSYMICTKYGGAIYFHDDGQALLNVLDKILSDSDSSKYQISINGIKLIQNFELTEQYAKATGIGAFDENGKMIGIYPHYVFKWDKERQIYYSDGGITFGFGHYINEEEYKNSISEKKIIDEYNLAGQFIPPYIPEGGRSYKVPGSVYMPIDEAQKLLEEDLTDAEDALNDFLSRNMDKEIILEQNQFDALVSFTHQYGTNWWNEEYENRELPRLLLEGRYENNEEVKRVFSLHEDKDRRAIEAEVFVNGYEEVTE